MLLTLVAFWPSLGISSSTRPIRPKKILRENHDILTLLTKSRDNQKPGSVVFRGTVVPVKRSVLAVCTGGTYLNVIRLCCNSIGRKISLDIYRRSKFFLMLSLSDVYN